MRRFAAAVGALALPAALLVASGAPSIAADCTIAGTDGDDVLRGTAGRDQICGLAGNDRLVGLEGDDVLLGGPGDDMLVGHQGNDRLVGGAGHDSLVPGAGDDTVEGGTDRDNVSYRDLAGGVVVDLAAGTASGDQTGTDELLSIEGMTGTPGDDTLLGFAGKNYIEALGGDDIVWPRDSTSDLMHGGSGADTVNLSDLTHGVHVRPGAVVDGFENQVGTPYYDTLHGDPGANRLSGGGGGDVLHGRGGSDSLHSDAGNDHIYPGTGSDLVDGGSGRDAVRYADLVGPIWVELDAGTVDKGDGTIDELVGIEDVGGTWSNDHLSGGLGATEVRFLGWGGIDYMNTEDGFGGDTMWQNSREQGSTCVGDPTDTRSYC